MGRVVAIEVETSLFKKIEVVPAFRIQDLDLLAVIKTDIKEFF